MIQIFFKTYRITSQIFIFLINIYLHDFLNLGLSILLLYYLKLYNFQFNIIFFYKYILFCYDSDTDSSKSEKLKGNLDWKKKSIFRRIKCKYVLFKIILNSKLLRDVVTIVFKLYSDLNVYRKLRTII